MQLFIRNPLLFLVLLLSSTSGYCQTASPRFDSPGTVQVADTPSVFKLKILGSGSSCTGTSTLGIKLPSGFIYINGSAAASPEGTAAVITELYASGDSALLSVSAIPAGPDSVIILYKARAGCGTIGGSGTTISYRLNTCSGISAATTTVNTKSAQLNITGITNNTFVAAYMGQVFTRSVTIANNGYGSIDTAYLDSKNTASLAVIAASVNTGVLQFTKSWSGTDTTYRYRVTAATANGHLDLGESIVITETVVVKNCAANTTQYKAWFGLNGTECSAVSNTNTAGVLAVVGTPNMASSFISPDLTCAPRSNYAILKLKNTGSGAMLFNGNFILSAINSLSAGSKNGVGTCAPTAYIDTSSAYPVQISRNGGASWEAPLAYTRWSYASTSSVINPGKYCGINIAGLVPAMVAGDSIWIRYGIRADLAIANCCNAGTAGIYMPVPTAQYTYTNGCGLNPITESPATDYGYFSVRTLHAVTAEDAAIRSPYTLTFATNVYKHGVNASWTNSTGYFQYDIYIPTALRPYTAPDSNKLGTVSPNFVNWNTTTRIMTLRYPQASFGIDNYTEFLLKIATMTDTICGTYTSTISACGKATACASDSVQFLCNVPASITLHQCPNCPSGGPVGDVPIIERTNYGIYSGGNNGIPGGTFDKTNLRLDRMIFGDTISLTTRARISAGAAGSSFSHIFADLNTDTGTISYRSSIAYVYRSGSLVNTITAMPIDSSAVSAGKRKYRLDAAKGSGAPAAYNAGDSIVFNVVFSNRVHGPVDVKYGTNIFAANTATPLPAEEIVCDGNFTAKMSNIQFSVFNGTNSTGSSVSGCGNQVPTGYMQIMSVSSTGSSSAKHGQFPYEIRPFTQLRQARAYIPSFLVLDSMKVTMNGQGAGGTFTMKPSLDSTVISGTYTYYYFNISNISDLIYGPGIPIGEGFYLYIAPYTRPDCYTANYTYAATAGASYRNLVDGDGTYIWREYGFNTFSSDNSLLPLNISSPLSNIVSSSDTASWDLVISNPTTVIKPNVWLTKSPTPANTVSIVKVEELSGAGGSVIAAKTAVSGIFQLGNLNATATKYYRVTATYSNCVKDSLRLLTDYACSDYPASATAAAASCRVKTQDLSVTAQTATLQLSIVNQPTSFDLCDTLDMEFNVLNSGLGNATDLSVSIQLPAPGGGLQYVAGSGALKYPAAAITYIPLSAAAVTVSGDGRQLSFKVPASTIPVLHGSESYNIRFRLVTMPCTFVSGVRISAQPLGANQCSNPLVGAMASSNKLQLNGTPSVLPQFTISSRTDSMDACGSGSLATLYRFKLVNTGGNSTTINDGFRIGMPDGWTMDTALSFTHNPSGATFAREAASGLYDYATGTGLAPGDSIVFTTTLKAATPQTLSCGNNTITESGIVNFTAVCSSMPATVCKSVQLLDPVRTSTGILIRKPNLAISNVTLDAGRWSIGGVSNNVHLSYTNNGMLSYTANTDTAEFFCGSRSTPFAKRAITQSLLPGGTATDDYSIIVPAAVACSAADLVTVRIQAVTAAGTAQCLCIPAAFQMNGVPLPTGFLHCQAQVQDCAVTLSWEYNNSLPLATFAIQRSGDGQHFTEQASLPAAAGNYTDVSPAAGTWFYRVKANGIDGKQSYSPLQTVQTTMCNGNSVRVYPNPASDALYIVLQGQSNINSYELLDMLGRKLDGNTLQANSNNEIPTRNLPNGIYLLRIITDANSSTQQVQIRR